VPDLRLRPLTSDFRPLTSDSGLWPLASGLWPLASGLWPERGHSNSTVSGSLSQLSIELFHSGLGVLWPNEVSTRMVRSGPTSASTPCRLSPSTRAGRSRAIHFGARCARGWKRRMTSPNFHSWRGGSADRLASFRCSRARRRRNALQASVATVRNLFPLNEAHLAPVGLPVWLLFDQSRRWFFGNASRPPESARPWSASRRRASAGWMCSEATVPPATGKGALTAWVALRRWSATDR